MSVRNATNRKEFSSNGPKNAVTSECAPCPCNFQQRRWRSRKKKVVSVRCANRCLNRLSKGISNNSNRSLLNSSSNRVVRVSTELLIHKITALVQEFKRDWNTINPE